MDDGGSYLVLGTWYLVLGTCYREAVLTRRKGFQCNTAFPPPSPWFFGVCRSFCSDYLRGEKHTLIKISDFTFHVCFSVAMTAPSWNTPSGGGGRWSRGKWG